MAKTRADLFAEQAQDAFRRGQDAARGRRCRRRAALDRARPPLRPRRPDAAFRARPRLAPPGRSRPRRPAAGGGGASRCDVREAWLALASARAGLGQAGPAAAALQALLSRHVLPDDAGFAGWPTTSPAPPAVRAGAAAGATAALPPTARAPLTATLDGRRLAAAPPRPRRPPSGTLALSAGGRALLGSPLDLAAFGRVEGFVAAARWRAGGLGLASRPTRKPRRA